jgi:pimeloyl-ACP methyl ester carboxylesterase
MRWFMTNLLRHYCETFDTGYLLDLLDYLGYARITRKLLEPVDKIKIIHGERDKIAPIQEAIDIKNALGRTKFIPVKDAGHMLFLETDISGAI